MPRKGLARVYSARLLGARRQNYNNNNNKKQTPVSWPRAFCSNLCKKNSDYFWFDIYICGLHSWKCDRSGKKKPRISAKTIWSACVGKTALSLANFRRIITNKCEIMVLLIWIQQYILSHVLSSIIRQSINKTTNIRAPKSPAKYAAEREKQGKKKH